MACKSHQGQICQLTGLTCVEPGAPKWLAGATARAGACTVYHAVVLRTCPESQMFQRNEGGALKGRGHDGEIPRMSRITIVRGTQRRVK